MYLFLFVLFRVVIRRRIGAVGMADILVLVIMADAAQNAMSGEYKSITDGAILVGTIIAWDVLIDWLNFRAPALRPWLEPPPLLLVREGQLICTATCATSSSPRRSSSPSCAKRG